MRFFINNFLKGCLVLVPTVVTLYAAWLAFTTIDGWLGYGVPGAGFVVTVVLITLIGFLTSNVVGKRVFGVTERVLTRVPLLKLLYTSLKDVVGALVGERKTFDRPVAVRLGDEGGPRAFGFVTREDLSAFGLPDEVAVYFPQSINFAGNLLIVPRERVTPLEVDASELMTFVVSGGVSGKRVPGDSVRPQVPA